MFFSRLLEGNRRDGRLFCSKIFLGLVEISLVSLRFVGFLFG